MPLIPLIMLGKGKKGIVKKVMSGGKAQNFIESLGVTEGTTVRVVSDDGGSLIIQIFESRVAISREIGLKIMVEECI